MNPVFIRNLKYSKLEMAAKNTITNIVTINLIRLKNLFSLNRGKKRFVMKRVAISLITIALVIMVAHVFAQEFGRR